MSFLFYDECDKKTCTELTEGEHGILFHPLKVVLSKDEDGWFAQGLDIDHFAQGKTEKEVIESFIRSLGVAIKEHLNTHGHLNYLTLPAAPEEWKEWTNSKTHVISKLYKLNKRRIKEVKKIEKYPSMNCIAFKRSPVHA